MGESNEWLWIVIALVAIAGLWYRSYRDKKGTYTSIPPEARKQWNTWPCPSCGAQNHPEERSQDGHQVRGVCSACGKPWSGRN